MLFQLSNEFICEYITISISEGKGEEEEADEE